MKLKYIAPFFIASAIGTAHAANFIPGNLVVHRVGDGSTTLSSSSAAISVLEYTPSGTLQQVINLPTSGSGALTSSGTATSEGMLNTYGNTIYVPGYNANAGVASIASTASNTAPRGVIGIGSDGTYGTPATAGTGYTANNIRSAIGTGSQLFASGTASGTNSGVRYFTSSTDSIRVSSTVTNVRNLEIYSQSLYFSTGSGTTGIYSLGTVGSLDVSAADQNTATLAIASASPYGFYVNPTVGVAFLADDGIGASGGIRRFDFDTNTSTWTPTWSLRLDMTNNLLSSATTGVFSARGLAVDYDEINQLFSIFATNTVATNNQLISFTDGLASTVGAGNSFNVLASSGSNYVFRGVDFAPIPEPSSALLGGLGLLALLRRRR